VRPLIGGRKPLTSVCVMSSGYVSSNKRTDGLSLAKRENVADVPNLFQVQTFAIMPEKFTAAERDLITKASQDLHRYERIAEEHSVILRKDLDGLNRAHQEYAANSPPMGFLPPRDEFNRYIEESEKVLTKKCRTLLEHATCCKFNGVIMCQSTVFCSHVRGKRCFISLPGSTTRCI
jgi:hypothetical protein